MITLNGLTKRYGETVAVDGVDLAIAPGRVTGFLGPNGSGKSTTMRLILGLDSPTRGTALIDGKPYAALRHPLRRVGALLDARSLHPGRRARSHLVAMARSNGIPVSRVDEVLGIVGLEGVARKRAGSFSLGMGQRLGVAGALLGDPDTLILDEPVNGLDPDGVRWVRELLRGQAAQGRTVFLSSHLMSEMQLTADHLVVIGRGRVIADGPVEAILGASSTTAVRVRVPDPDDHRRLVARLRERSLTVSGTSADTITVAGNAVAEVGDLAFAERVRLHELRVVEASLEEAYLEITAASVEYGAEAGR
ncbi:ATP-binding cassette domain-containing protein [Actinokineospora bangkokensis]|uniref:Multidrug ABC transporter ATP-binding protein n=1 Tax=Actinokineospora bangkokensis TaxID=1193682 RepID=A0A1Q9LMC5_9PSEU|nr:ATP-binding cassette domain-containing protein [Actinokineospora bangkokensis]OLR93180.1 multidrug ABC transporter ATP-binding protein [Actinokineospora bangkokensis]